jgi:hypothetical protein
MSDYVKASPVARSIPYDDQKIPTNLGNDLQTAIDTMYQQSKVAASPGFSWGRSGNIPSNTWLLNDSVPSNRSGRTIMLNNGVIEKVSVATEDIDTYNLEIYQHDGNEINLTLLYTINVVATRAQQYTIPNIAITQGKQLAIKVGTGSAKNIVVGLIAKGNI